MILVHLISSLEQGGAQTVLFELVTRLGQYEHHIICVHDGWYTDLFRKLNIPVYRISGFTLRGFVQLIGLLKKIKPDGLHTSLWGANLFGRMAGWWLSIPHTMVLHNHKNLNGVIRNTIDYCIPTTQTVIAVSDEVKKSFQISHAHVIRNGVSRFTGVTKTKQSLGFQEHDFVIGSVGRFHPDKQYELLIESYALLAQKYKAMRLVLLGAGAQEQALRALVQKLGVQDTVRFIIGESAQSYYGLFDCFVLTSRSEGISLALLEAMGNGVPVISTHHSAQHAVINHDDNGILVSHDPIAIASAIASLYHDRDKRASLIFSARRTIIDHFGVDKMIGDYAKIFDAMCMRNH